MNSLISFTTPTMERLDAQKRGTLCFFRFWEKEPFTGVLGQLDWRLLGHLSKMAISDFITGANDETVLIPPGSRIPQEYVLLLGLGSREEFNRDRYTQVLKRLIFTAKRLGSGPLTITLPGRPEEVCDATNGIDWFLSFLDDAFLDNALFDEPITVIETIEAQQVMLPAVERWRLKHSVPAPPTKTQ